ncbi:MAG: carbohydrate porin [Candidatus Omnitrophica bacterium]|nr:carbohydrate porin [Candidatus Omnitrophota bacterium]
MRSSLADKGVTLSANFTTDIAGNPSGGSRQGATYAGFLQVAAALDFEKLVSLEGWALTLSNYVASGRNLSNEIGNFYGVQEIYAPGDYYSGELDLSLTLAEERVVLEFGRLFAGDVFATSPLWQYYVSAINSNIISMSGNVFFPHFQVAAWGARATYEPDKQWQFVAGVYDANPKIKDPGRHGLDFSFNTDHDCLAVGQLTYKHDQGKEGGLPGSATFGGYYESSKFSYLADPTRTRRGNYGLYFIIDQMIYRGDWPEFTGPAHLSSQAGYSERVKYPYYPRITAAADRPKGLTAWWSTYLAPQEKINAQTYQLAAGLVYQGLVPNRDRDVTAFCVIYGNFSDDLAGQDAETVLELNHRFQVSPWCYITPDIQYVFNPDGRHNIDNALVLGAEASFSF